MDYEELTVGKPGCAAGAASDEAAAAERALEDLRRGRRRLARAWERSSELLKRAAELDQRASSDGVGGGMRDEADSNRHAQDTVALPDGSSDTAVY